MIQLGGELQYLLRAGDITQATKIQQFFGLSIKKTGCLIETAVEKYVYRLLLFIFQNDVVRIRYGIKVNRTITYLSVKKFVSLLNFDIAPFLRLLYA